MNSARNMAPLLAGVAFLTMAFCGTSRAEQFPEIFHGVWIVGVAENSACKAGDWEKHEDDGLLRVDKREALFFASACSVKSLRPWDGGPSVDLKLTCEDEGEFSSTREIWSVVDIGTRKALVMTQLEASAGRREGSKKATPMRRELGARIYLACE